MSGLLLCAAVAAQLRLPGLGERPMHADESVHAVKLGDLLDTGRYAYDFNEFHGPTLYYASLPLLWLHGVHRFDQTTEEQLRQVTAVWGVLLVLAVVLLADGLGVGATLAAALLTAVSSALVYYSRYYIQETPLTCFALLLLGCVWRWQRSGRRGWLLAVGVCAGLLVATKETCVLNFGALALGLAAARGDQRMRPRDLGLAALVALATAGLLLSGLRPTPAGLVNFVKSFGPWLHRAQGSGLHRHEWSFYFHRLLYWHRPGAPVWSEGLIAVLALVGCVAAWRPAWLQRAGVAAPLARLLAVYSLALTLVYTLIPYKTPWCLLGFWDGWILLAGLGAAVLVSASGWRGVRGLVSLVLLAGAVQLGWQSWRLNHRANLMAEGRNPYGYVLTAPDVVEVAEDLEEMQRLQLDGRPFIVKVYSSDGYYWPLPWYLRRIPHVGWLTGLDPSDRGHEADISVVLNSPELSDAVKQEFEATHELAGHVGLRRGKENIYQLWLEKRLQAALIQSRQRH